MKVLLCKPYYLSVPMTDPDNKHMNPAVRPIIPLAILQHSHLARLYQDLGLKVIFIPAVPGLVDMTFTANCGIIAGNKFIPGNFKPARRRGETAHFSKFFESLGYEICSLPPGIFFEGAGDAIIYKDKILCGYGFRTSFKALAHLERIAECEVVPLRLINRGAKEKNLYHFNTTTIVLEDLETFITYPKAFDWASLRRLERLGSVIPASYEDAANLALNAVVVPRNEINIPGRGSDFALHLDFFLDQNPIYRGVALTSALASQKLQKQLIKLKYAPILIHLGEFLKSGGGAFCLTKIL